MREREREREGGKGEKAFLTSTKNVATAATARTNKNHVNDENNDFNAASLGTASSHSPNCLTRTTATHMGGDVRRSDKNILPS